MTPITLLNVLLFICIVAQGFAVEPVEKRPTQVRRTYRYTYRTPANQRRYSTTTRRYGTTQRRYGSTRRTTGSTSGGSKSPLFTRIMQRIQNIRHKHTDHSKVATRKTTNTRPTTRRVSTWSRRTAPVERPSTRRQDTRTRRTMPYRRVATKRVTAKPVAKKTGKKPSLFDRIMGRVTNIRNNGGNTQTSRKTVQRPPTRRVNSWSRRTPPVERPPTRRVSTRPTTRRTWSRKTAPVERPPTRRVNTRPTTRRVSTWSRKPAPVERPPTRRVSTWTRRTTTNRKVAPKRLTVKTVETKPKPVATKPGKKHSLFHRIMNRVTNIRNDGGKPKTSKWKPKTAVTSKYVPKPRVTTWIPHTCLRKGCRMSNGVQTNHVSYFLNRAYRGDKKKLLKVASWNIFEGKTPRNYLTTARREVCARLKLMQPTVLGFQDASIQQYREIEKCLSRLHYGKMRGRGRYDYSSRRWLYNPIFYRTKSATGPSLTKRSEGAITTTITLQRRRRTVPIATYTKLRLTIPKSSGQQAGQPKKKNNINQLWKRLNTIYNNAHNGKSTSSSSSRSSVSASPITEVIIVNTNLITDKPDVAESQIKEVLKRLPAITNYWKTPVILMGDLKFEDNSKVYKAIHDIRKFDNTFDKHVNKHAHPMLTRFRRRYQPQDLVHYILESKLKTVFAATMSDRLPSDNYKPLSFKPIFAAFQLP